jgi:F-type H+-transporting ATPase subunit delta
VELDPNERQTIESRLRGAHGDDLEIAYHVEPDLIGGVIVRVGDRYLDASVASKLGQLRQDLVTGRVG